MKGIVVTLPRKSKNKEKSLRSPSVGVVTYLRRYGAITFYTFCFAVGMLIGSLSARSAGEGVRQSLDMLFTTNLSARLSQPMYMTFVSGLSSNFLFFLCAFLCGLSLWGLLPLFLIPAFKGYGTGLSAGYLFLNFGLKGIGFYLLVILAGTFLFTFSLIIECSEAHRMSFRLMRFFMSDKSDRSTTVIYLRSFLLHSLFLLVLSVMAALCDMLLWTFFAKMFF